MFFSSCIYSSWCFILSLLPILVKVTSDNAIRTTSVRIVLDSDSNIILSTVTLYRMLILDVIVGQMRSTQDAWCTEMMH